MKTRISTPWNLSDGLHRLARAVLQLLLLVSALCGCAITAGGADRQWTGAGGDNLFSNPNNWNPVGDLQEENDRVSFPAGADAYNDLRPEGLAPRFRSVEFTGSGTARIGGEPIRVIGGIFCRLTGGPVQIDLEISSNGGYAIYVGEGGTLTVTRSLLGLFPGVEKTGLGTLILSATNRFSSFLISEGVVTATSDHAVGFDLGPDTVTVAGGGTLQLLAPVAARLTLRGNGLGGTNGALMIPANSSLTLTRPITLVAEAIINVAKNASLAIDSEIQGNGRLIKIGPGELSLVGAIDNTYASSTVVNEGTLYLSKDQNVIAVPRSLIVAAAPGASAAARFIRSGMMYASQEVTVNANSLLDLNGQNQTLSRLNLNDGGEVQTGAGTLGFTVDGVVSVGTLNPPEVGLRHGSSISGRIALPVLDYLTFEVAPYARGHFPGESELEISAAISGNGNIIKLGQGALRLSGANTFNDAPPNLSGDVVVNEGSLIAANAKALGGTAGATWVNNSAMLALAGGIAIDGETVYLNSDNSPALHNLAGYSAWNGPIHLSRDSIIGIPDNSSMQAGGVISGTGDLTKVGAGSLRMDGMDHNTYAGTTFVNEGALVLNKTYGFQAVPGSLVISQPDTELAASVVYLNHDQVLQNITVNGNGLLDLNGYDEYEGSLTLNGGGDVRTGRGSLYVLSGGITVNPGSNTVSTISGKLGFDTGKHTIHVGSGVSVPGLHELVISAAIFEANPVVSLEKTGAGSVLFTGTNIYTGTNFVLAGKLRVDGFQPQSRVHVNGGTLLGRGTVGPIDFGGASGQVAPGSSAGVLTSGNFNAGGTGGGTLSLELNGPSLGSQYDQLDVRGTVTLTGLTLQPSVMFPPTVGTVFTIINNDGADAVTGTFPGLPQGATFNAGGELFSISYAGGDGNDVVLTHRSSVPQIRVTTLPATQVANYAVDFDGNDDRVQVATNLFPTVTNNFTMELWANPSGFRTAIGETNEGISGFGLQRFAVFPDQGDLSYGGLGQGHAGAGLSIGFNGISVYEHANNFLPSTLVYSADLVGWTHVALVYSNKLPRLYLNGVLVRTGVASPKAFLHPGANLGGSIQGIGYGNFQGQLDEVRIWNTALSEGQIQSRFNRGLTGSESGLVAYYRCDENGGTSIGDSAPALPNRSGALTNGAAFVLSGALAPDVIYGSTVTLNALANPESSPGAVWFEWGATTNYGNVTAARAVASGFRNTNIVQQLMGLAAGSYHFRTVGSNSFGLMFGGDQSFTLSALGDIGSIGLNFGADEYPGAPFTGTLPPTSVAGVVPQAHWNNLNGASGVFAGLVAHFDGVSVLTPASVTWSSLGTWSSTGRAEENNGFVAGGDRTLMTGYLDTSDQLAGAATVTVSGLDPRFTYDVIVYCVGGVAGRGGAYTIGSMTKYGTAPANPVTHSEDLGNDLSDTGTYVHFRGLSGLSFTLTAEATPGSGRNFRAPVNGIQIVGRPRIESTRLPNGSIRLSWEGSGQLQAANELLGSGSRTVWTDVAGGNLSPVTVTPGQLKGFYRVRR